MPIRSPRSFLPAAALLTLLLSAPAARADTEQTFQSWTAYFLQARLAEGASAPGLWFDAHARRGADATTFLFRPGAGWYFGALSLWAGYLWVPTVVDGGADRHEHRPWEQLMWTPRWDDLALTVRTRFEQRLVQGEDDVGLRLRQLVRGQYGVGAEWALVLWDEAFFGLNETSWGQPRGLDQNRLFVGPAWLPADGVRFEPGYLLVWLPRPETSTVVHALSVNLFTTF